MSAPGEAIQKPENICVRDVRQQAGVKGFTKFLRRLQPPDVLIAFFVRHRPLDVGIEAFQKRHRTRPRSLALDVVRHDCDQLPVFQSSLLEQGKSRRRLLLKSCPQKLRGNSVVRNTGLERLQLPFGHIQSLEKPLLPPTRLRIPRRNIDPPGRGSSGLVLADFKFELARHIKTPPIFRGSKSRFSCRLLVTLSDK